MNSKEQKPRIGNDNVCPVTKGLCDDETCTPGSECNVSGNKITSGPSEHTQKQLDELYPFADESVCEFLGVSRYGVNAQISDIRAAYLRGREEAKGIAVSFVGWVKAHVHGSVVFQVNGVDGAFHTYADLFDHWYNNVYLKSQL